MSAWELIEHGHDPARAAALESVHAVGNGYLGVRGTHDEGTPAHDPGVILNGFHETWPIVYPEDAYGLARTGQTIVGPPDGSILRLIVDDEPFDVATARVLAYERTLDLRTGVLLRDVTYAAPRSGRIRLRSRRLASLADRHLVAIDYEVTPLDGPARVAVRSELVTHAPLAGGDDPRRGGFTGRALRPVVARADGTRAALRLATTHSGLELACGMDHRVEADVPVRVEPDAEGDRAEVRLLAELPAGATLRVSKSVAYHWAPRREASDLLARVDGTLDRATAAGHAAVEQAHAGQVAAFWHRSDVEIEGAPAVQRAVRFNLFSLMQATARSEGLGVAAKGVTGRGYEGQYFWDTEIYVVPFLIHTSPDWARHALEFRCATLDAARARAREIGHGGAAFPWRTINGEEASAWYAAGTAQHHVGADIAYAMRHYAWVAGDLEFVLECGAEVLIETARLWMELGFFSARHGGAFCINAVTGPDEYTTVVDNNAYTNLMARENLEGAVRVMEWLQGQDEAAHARLASALGVTPAEVEAWRTAAERMYVPRDAELGIVLQDEHFLDREPWDFDATPPDRYPLLLHYHPLELYRHQVIKQTDVVLATYLVDRAFDAEETRRTFDYYDALTTGDSTLSACVQSVMASAVGHADAALAYFEAASTIDLADAHGNTADGLHIAACGGTWLALVAGFGGLRDFDGDVRMDPKLPAAWERLRFRIRVRGQLLEVDITHAGVAYRLVEGSVLVLSHRGEALRIVPGEAVWRPEEEALPRAA